ncbi:LPS export ABC transporter permease LptF [Paenalcaligenes sp.]|uniref:LPS export ABC transporter permease LptF n=1 Tax=Paenalcaligenes sp. TaxID=1966342 RepID=UPI00262FFB33|nr:LPS export ABC transporter permease LptF [Paenalcaligenes sp.]
MSLFKRTVISEILSHAGVVLSTLLIVWLSVLLVRLLGEAAGGSIGPEVVLSLAVFSSLTALPVILTVSLFIAVLSTVTRSYRESEMVVWFTSGLSLRDWVRPVLFCVVPVALLILLLTFYASPWAYRQMSEYRQRYELRSDLSKVTVGQFIETENGQRVFFTESPESADDELGKVVARVIDENGWVSVITADSAHVETQANEDRFLVLSQGQRYDVRPDDAQLRLVHFENYGVRLESKDDQSHPDTIRAKAEQQIKGRPTEQLIQDQTDKARAQIMWRLAMPLAILNLCLLAIPLGAVNPRLGKSGDVLFAGLIGLLYMNLINLSRGWIANGVLDMWLGGLGVHAVFFGFMLWMFWLRLRIKAPKNTVKSS